VTAGNPTPVNSNRSAGLYVLVAGATSATGIALEARGASHFETAGPGTPSVAVGRATLVRYGRVVGQYRPGAAGAAVRPAEARGSSRRTRTVRPFCTTTENNESASAAGSMAKEKKVCKGDIRGGVVAWGSGQGLVENGTDGRVDRERHDAHSWYPRQGTSASHLLNDRCCGSRDCPGRVRVRPKRSKSLQLQGPSESLKATSRP